MANKDLQTACLLGILSQTLGSEDTRYDITTPLIAILAITEEEERAKKRNRTRREQSRDATGLLKRSPLPPDVPSHIGTPLLFGASSNYSTLHAYPLSSYDYYTHFRFSREDIPKLVRELHIPHRFEQHDDNDEVHFQISGEEAFLIFLKVNRHIQNSSFHSIL